MTAERVFKLSEIEKNSQLWRRLKEHLEYLDDVDRKRNDNMSLTGEETRCIRARIAARKSLLELER